MTRRRRNLLYFGFLALTLFAIKIGWVIPDGAGYCSYNASLVFDGDLNFWNQYSTSGIITRGLIHGSALTAKGYVFTYWAIGAPMLWMFFWLIGHALTIVSQLFGQSWTPNGFTVYYNFAVRFGTAAMGLCAITMNYYSARRYVDHKAATWGVLLIAFGTPFFWYTYQFADQSHVPAAFSISLFLLTWDAYRRGSREMWNGFLLGMLAGWAGIIKPNHAVIILFPLSMWISEIKSKPLKSIFREALIVAAGTLFAVLLQLWIWYILFGNPLGPVLEKGVTHYYKFFTGHFWLMDVLFSSYHGLFFFGPILIFSFWGLLRLLKIDPVIAIPSLFVLLFQILLMANERYFWEGAAFGLRRVVDWTPLFAIGLAVAMAKFRHLGKGISIAAALWTLLLIFTYQQHPAGILNDYQPPKMVVSWMIEAIKHFPSAVRSMLSFPAPPDIFVPAFLILSIAGYALFYAITQLTSQSQSAKCSRVLTFIVISCFIFTYILVGRAAVRGEESKQEYASQLQWLGERQEVIMSIEEVSFLLNEGKYLALTRDWSTARNSFVEAVRLSPNPDTTLLEIEKFARIHQSGEDAAKYVQDLQASR